MSVHAPDQKKANSIGQLITFGHGKCLMLNGALGFPIQMTIGVTRATYFCTTFL